MTELEKEIDYLQIAVNTSKRMVSQYKNPKELLKSIKRNEQYLEWFRELNEYRNKSRG